MEFLEEKKGNYPFAMIDLNSLPNESEDSENQVRAKIDTVIERFEFLLHEHDTKINRYNQSLGRRTINLANSDVFIEFAGFFLNFKNADRAPKEELLEFMMSEKGYDTRNLQLLDAGFDLFNSCLKVSENFLMNESYSPFEKEAKTLSFIKKVDKIFDDFAKKMNCNWFTSEADDKVVEKKINKCNELLNTILKLAEIKNCDPSLITQLDVENHKVKLIEIEAEFKKKEAELESKKLWEELIISCGKPKVKKTSNSKKKTSKKNGKKTKSTSKSKIQPQIRVQTSLVSPLKNESIIFPRINPFDKMIQAIYQQSHYKDAHRVTNRWKTTDETLLREITDLNLDGQPIQKYKNLSKDKLVKQRKRHFIPGLEKIISSQFGKIYAFPIQGGYKMNALMNYGNGDTDCGSVEFGIDGKLVYHRYFQPYSNSNSKNFGMFAPAPKNTSLDNEGWEQVSSTNFKISPEGVLDVTFEGEEHFIRIFPVRKDLLDKYIKNFE